MGFQLKRSRLFEQVADVLEQRIRDRELAAGVELPSERQLMVEFGVGRTAIREALFRGAMKERAELSRPTLCHAEAGAAATSDALI